jgi:endonuclease YncB( thermonuclease family)
MKQLLLTVLLAAQTFMAQADTWIGRVVAVHDGDTLTVLYNGRGIKVRLDEIDAPELRQDFGRQAKKSLSGLCYGRDGEVHGQGQDKYGRVLARVVCAGTDANAEQVRRGFAWFYVQYAHDPVLRNLEASARARRAGLWAGSNPVPPWEFRHEGSTEGAGFIRRPVGAGARAMSCGAKKACGDMKSCEEAMYYLYQCGLGKLDRNRDGVPCESLCQ